MNSSSPPLFNFLSSTSDHDNIGGDDDDGENFTVEKYFNTTAEDFFQETHFKAEVEKVYHYPLFPDFSISACEESGQPTFIYPEKGREELLSSEYGNDDFVSFAREKGGGGGRVTSMFDVHPDFFSSSSATNSWEQQQQTSPERKRSRKCHRRYDCQNDRFTLQYASRDVEKEIIPKLRIELKPMGKKKTEFSDIIPSSLYSKPYKFSLCILIASLHSSYNGNEYLCYRLKLLKVDLNNGKDADCSVDSLNIIEDCPFRFKDLESVGHERNICLHTISFPVRLPSLFRFRILLVLVFSVKTMSCLHVVQNHQQFKFKIEVYYQGLGFSHFPFIGKPDAIYTSPEFTILAKKRKAKQPGKKQLEDTVRKLTPEHRVQLLSLLNSEI